MIFWRILDNKVYGVDEVDRLGFVKLMTGRVGQIHINTQKMFSKIILMWIIL